MLKEEAREDKTVDLFLFMGQSNMAGRGVANEKWPEEAPAVTKGAGYEFRAISDVTKLHKMKEPFGRKENNSKGITEPEKKTGSMVTAFTNAYYRYVGIPIVGVSASKGGSAIAEWQPGKAYLLDTITRMKSAEQFLLENGYHIGHRYMVWCQGESDADQGVNGSTYKSLFRQMLDEMVKQGIETCFLVQIGQYNGNQTFDYTDIRTAQDEIALENENVVMVSRSFFHMKERGLMKDSYHFYQKAYNEVGTEAGQNAAYFVNTGGRIL